MNISVLGCCSPDESFYVSGISGRMTVYSSICHLGTSSLLCLGFIYIDIKPYQLYLVVPGKKEQISRMLGQLDLFVQAVPLPKRYSFLN